MHDHPVICDNSKPEIIMYYNSTKGRVDTFDQMCSYQKCSRMTKRWPLLRFLWGFTAVVDSYILCKEYKPQNTLKWRLF